MHVRLVEVYEVYYEEQGVASSFLNKVRQLHYFAWGWHTPNATDTPILKMSKDENKNKAKIKVDS